MTWIIQNQLIDVDKIYLEKFGMMLKSFLMPAFLRTLKAPVPPLQEGIISSCSEKGYSQVLATSQKFAGTSLFKAGIFLADRDYTQKPRSQERTGLISYSSTTFSIFFLSFGPA